jgi:hypothetical protein
MFARKRSFVSWIVAWFWIGSFQRLARIEATAGLQTSQPAPRPCESRSDSNERAPVIFAIWNNSWRVCAKCSHRWFTVALPSAASSSLRIALTLGRQPPQPVPAFVSFFSAASSVSPFSRIA